MTFSLLLFLKLYSSPCHSREKLHHHHQIISIKKEHPPLFWSVLHSCILNSLKARLRMLWTNTLQKQKLKSKLGLSTHTFNFRKCYSHGTKDSMQEVAKILKENKKGRWFFAWSDFLYNTNYYFQQAIPAP